MTSVITLASDQDAALAYLAEARKHHTQAVIAKHLGVGIRTVSRWEARQTNPPAYVAHALQQLLPLPEPESPEGSFDFIDLFAGIGGIRKAFEKRPVAANSINKVADDIENELYKQGKQEVSSTVIGDMVMGHLKKIDQIAYIRFASVYRDFADITRLKQEVDNLARGEIKVVPSAQLPLLPDQGLVVGVKAGRGQRK